jgi:hypothetical protein
LENLLYTLLDLTNETLAAAIVVIAASLVLYNLTRNRRDPVARTGGILLACVTMAYLCDVFVSLGPSVKTYEATLRLQWLGIAYMPAAMFHLSDALLETTGLPSRGRRKRVVRFLYLLSTLFLILAAFSDWVIQPVAVGNVVSLRAKPLFIVYVAYFVVAAAVSFHNVQRARQRCLTRDTRRRMGYLQFAMLTPAIGIFPFSVLLGPGQEFSLIGLVLVNLTNIVVIFMLLFLSYPLSFFGSRIPDRVVKVELLRFLMRGPGTGLLALATIIFVAPITRVLSLPGQSFMPFAVVAVVLLWQWTAHLSLPWLERHLVYSGDDYEQLDRLQNLSERLLNRTDLMQLLEAILAATCDYLRVNTAFVAALGEGEPELISAVGPTRPTVSLLQEEADVLRGQFDANNGDELSITKWHSYWVVPLYSQRISDERTSHSLIGFLGIQARSTEIDLTADEEQMLHTFVRRAEQTLDDLRVQEQIFAALEGLLPQINLTRENTAAVEYKPGRTPVPAQVPLVDYEQFKKQVKAALTHYWGGPGLSESRLLELAIVREALPENDHNPSRALRAVLLTAIENQRPEGERKMGSPEWTVYNILEQRFIKRAKVREVAPRLALSEAEVYRKQNVAIKGIADTLIRMEQEHLQAHPDEMPDPTEPSAFPTKTHEISG